MKYKVECLVDESVSFSARIMFQHGRRVSLPVITFNKKGQFYLFESSKDMEPYKVGISGLAQMGKVSLKEFQVEAKLAVMVPAVVPTKTTKRIYKSKASTASI